MFLKLLSITLLFKCALHFLISLSDRREVARAVVVSVLPVLLVQLLHRFFHRQLRARLGSAVVAQFLLVSFEVGHRLYLFLVFFRLLVLRVILSLLCLHLVLVEVVRGLFGLHLLVFLFFMEVIHQVLSGHQDGRDALAVGGSVA